MAAGEQDQPDEGGPGLVCKECGHLIPLSLRTFRLSERVLVCPKCHEVNYVDRPG